MVLHDLIPDIHNWDISILATDISNDAVRRASRGWYADHEIERGLPAMKRSRHFHAEDKGWRVDDSLRALITFKRLNLLEPFTGMGSFDIILCRNVAIYFTPDDRSKLFHRLADGLPEDGYLFVGSSESLSDLGPRFAPQLHCRSVYYRPNLIGSK
jgi:chemotaxis protein methyltransferase CheR